MELECIKSEDDEVVLACRSCLATQVNLTSIHDLGLGELLGDFTGFPVSPTDSYPQLVCDMCRGLLRKFLSFRMRCHSAMYALQQMEMNNIKITTNSLTNIERAHIRLNLQKTDIERIHCDGNSHHTNIINIDQNVVEKTNDIEIKTLEKYVNDAVLDLVEDDDKPLKHFVTAMPLDEINTLKINNENLEIKDGDLSDDGVVDKDGDLEIEDDDSSDDEVVDKDGDLENEDSDSSDDVVVNKNGDSEIEDGDLSDDGVVDNDLSDHSDDESESPINKRKISMPNLNMEMKMRITALHKLGYKLSQIVAETGLAWVTVKRWVKRYKEEGDVVSRPRSGRARHINDAQRLFMLRQYENNGFVKTSTFAEMFDTSSYTVNRTLLSLGLHNRKPAKIPQLTETEKRNRLLFAKKYLDFDWENVIFSDAKSFVSSETGWLHLRPYKTRHEEQNISLWGWMSAAGPGELVSQITRASALNYVDILDKTMLPTVRCVYPAIDMPDIVFVQDNCPIHRARVVKDWFHQNPDITVIPLPAKSPDLNPIQNLWRIMVQRWDFKNKRTMQALEAHCMEIWEDLRGTDVCSNIVGSMHKRLLAVIENNGGHITPNASS